LELNWSTFFLEIVNFLVLVWILQRFLYKPALAIIAKRRAIIEKTMADAKSLEANAKDLQQRYEGRLADWEEEQRAARESLSHEIDEQRSRRLAELRATLKQESEKAQVAEEHRLNDLRRQCEHVALAQGARFVSRLLQGFADKDLQARLVAQTLTDLSSLPDERAAALVGNREEPPRAIVVTSAFTVPDEQRERIRDVLTKVTGLKVPIDFREDPALLAGLRITIGAWVLGLNLQDELDGFARLSDAES
jgi:F-type H+-transporting ATPase subunit b